MTIHEYNARLDANRLPILKEGQKYNIDGRVSYDNADALARLAMDTIGLSDCAEEYAYIIAMDTKLRVKIGLVNVGTMGGKIDRRGNKAREFSPIKFKWENDAILILPVNCKTAPWREYLTKDMRLERRTA